MAMNHLVKNSWTRLVSTLCTRSHFITTTQSCRRYCSDSSGNTRNNSELEELWSPKEGQIRCSANHVPLSPIGFLERAAKVYRDRTSVIYGSLKYTWAQTHHRCLKLASALTQLGISRGDVVATLAPNVPAMYELHFAAPMAGAVLTRVGTVVTILATGKPTPVI